jgi:hypothetical protein
MDRVVVFLDWQNVYKGAREAFHSYQDPHWLGQVDPVRLAQAIAADSPFERELVAVRVYRGRPDSMRDPKGYAASARQIARWRESPLVDVTLRTLRYPRGWPTSHEPGEKPQEKGIDVALAIDFVRMATENKYDVGILMSTDTDLKPALEAVVELTRTYRRPRAEVAAWSASKQHSRRLSITGRKLYCHWLDATSYKSAADPTDYSRP